MATTVSLKPNAVEISGSTSGTTTLQATAVAGTTTLTLPAATDTLVGKATTDTLTNKTLTGAAMNGTLGATTASTANVTTLTTSSTITHNGGTANGVAYLNGSKVLTTGSALVFDGSNLGIGTTSPYSAAGYSSTTLNGTTGSQIRMRSSGTDIGLIFNTASEFYVYTSGAIPLVLSTNDTERARIDTSGNLLVGTTSGSYHTLVKDIGGNFATEIRNPNANPYGLYIRYSGAAPNGSVNEFLYVGDTVGQKMSIRSNGGIANYSGSNVNLSDRREKTNFAPAKSYLDVICAIPVQTFNYIDQNMEDDGGLTLGVVAQDVQAVAPELVMESNWASKDDEPKMRLSIYQTDLQYALMKCIQEQQALITQLQADVAALKGASA